MKYFIYAMFFILSITALKAQDFFVPTGAFSSPNERIQPLEEDAEDQLSSFSQRRYRVLDGRVYALPDEIDTQEEFEQEEIVNEDINIALPLQPESAESADKNINSQVVVSETITQPVEPTIKEEKITVETPKVNPPKLDAVDEKLPSYKNRYALYLADLETFQKTGKMPKNQDLSSTIEKLSKPYEVILFEGKLD